MLLTNLCLKDESLHALISHSVIEYNATWAVYFKDELVFEVRRSDYLAKKGLTQPGLYYVGSWSPPVSKTLAWYIGKTSTENSENGYVFSNSRANPTYIDGKNSPCGLQFVNSVTPAKSGNNLKFGNVRGKTKYPPLVVVKPLKSGDELLAKYDWRTGTDQVQFETPELQEFLAASAVSDDDVEYSSKKTLINEAAMTNPENWRICLLTGRMLRLDDLDLSTDSEPDTRVRVLTGLFDQSEIEDWCQSTLTVETQTSSRSKRIIPKTVDSWRETLVKAAKINEEQSNDPPVVPSGLAGVVDRIQYRDAGKYDMLLSPAGSASLMAAASETINRELKAEIDNAMTPECKSVSYHVMVTLPSRGRQNQAVHQDAPDDTCYQTIIVPLTHEDPAPATDGLPKGGGTVFIDIGHVNPYGGLVSFDGRVAHYGLGNVSSSPRVFLFVVVYSGSDVNEPQRPDAAIASTHRHLFGDKGLWKTTPPFQTLVDAPHDGDCGTHLMRIIGHQSNDEIFAFYDRFAMDLTGQHYILKPQEYVDMLFLVAYITVVLKANAIVIGDSGSPTYTRRPMENFAVKAYIGNSSETIVIVRCHEDRQPHWVALVPSSTRFRFTATETNRLVSAFREPIEKTDPSTSYLLSPASVASEIAEATDRGELVTDDEVSLFEVSDDSGDDDDAYQKFKKSAGRINTKAIAEWAWRTEGRADDDIIGYTLSTRLPISYKDIQTLDPTGSAGGWLSTKIIDAYTELLAKKSADNTHIIFGNTALTQQVPSKTPLERRVRRVLKKKPSFSDGLFIFFANVTNVHWVCCVIDSPAKTLRLYNSCGAKSDEYFQKIQDVAVIAFPDVDGWQDSLERVPEQNDGSSCGVFALQYAKCLVNGFDPNDVLESGASTQYRIDMVYEILEKELKVTYHGRPPTPLPDVVFLDLACF